MNVEQIKDIEALIQINTGKRITGHTVKRLTAPGENYGSLMLSVDISVSTPTGTEEINAVAKLVPPNELIQKIFNTQVTFRNEIAFYKNIVPILQDFQKEEHGVKKTIDFSAKYFGSRLNLNNNDSEVDSNAALVLENLNLSNYSTLDRLDGLDLNAANLVITNLAYLHAVPLALKLQKPDVFEKEVKSHLAPWHLSPEALESVRKDIKRLIDETEVLQPLEDRVFAGYDRLLEEHEPREPFATLTHNDCWTNNNMFKSEGTKAIESKMVDFQICDYGSPAKDVIFVIFSSVRNEVIAKHYDEFLVLYHQTFVAVLKELNCDTRAFTFDAFLEEIEFEAKHSQFGHLAFMIFPIYAPKGRVAEISELTIENMGQKEITDLQREKYVFFFNEFAKRKWI